MPDNFLFSTAYLPPIEYFSILSKTDKLLIEREENFIKQTYRNRCYILSAHGLQLLSVPVLSGSSHKTIIKDIKIDYSKRWQQVHLRAIISSYKAAPFFEFFFDVIEKIISGSPNYLLDLNMELTETLIKLIRIDTSLSLTKKFESVNNSKNDYRYLISPKKVSVFQSSGYLHVFNCPIEATPRLSIIDLLFNTGPEAATYL